MAQRNAWVLLTTGLARMEGENVMYTRASDNVPSSTSAMREIGYWVRGFLTVRKDSLRVPLNGSLTLHVDADSAAR